MHDEQHLLTCLLLDGCYSSCGVLEQHSDDGVEAQCLQIVRNPKNSVPMLMLLLLYAACVDYMSLSRDYAFSAESPEVDCVP